MSLQNNYFFDADESMVSYLENQVEVGIDSLLQAYVGIKERSEKVMSYLLISIGAMVLLLFNQPNLLQVEFARLMAYSLLLGWSLSAILLFTFVLKTRRRGIKGNAPEVLYNTSFKQKDDPYRKLLRLRQLNLINQSRFFGEQKKVNELISRWIDRVTMLAIITPIFAITFPYVLAG